MAKRKPKPEPEPDTTEPAVDPIHAEAEAHARAAAVTDPSAFEFPLPPAAETAPTAATAGGEHRPAATEREHTLGEAAENAGGPSTSDRVADSLRSDDTPRPNGEESGRTWKPLFSLRADHEAGVGLLEDRRFKQMQIRFAEKPSDEVRQVIREAGYQWRPQDRAWTKQLDPDAAWRTRAEAKALFDRVAALVRDEKGLGREVG